MTNEEAGRRILLLIDVQEPFLTGNTRGVVDFLQKLLREEKFDRVIQSCWRNYPDSRYETELGYREGREAQPLLRCPGEKVQIRSTYSAVNEELLGLLRSGDALYVAGLETDACVLATLFSLWDRGFRFRVYREGVGTKREGLHEPALAMIRRQFGGQVLL